MQPIGLVIEKLGGVAGAIDALKVSRATVYFWLKGREPEPKTCVLIERLTGVSRRELRADWREVWPELAQEPAGAAVSVAG